MLCLSVYVITLLFNIFILCPDNEWVKGFMCGTIYSQILTPLVEQGQLVGGYCILPNGMEMG